MRSHPLNGIAPKEIELDASWTSSRLEHCWNAQMPIVLRFLFKRGAAAERHLFYGLELIVEGNAFEGGTDLKCVIANSLEAFVEDDALEGGTFAEHKIFDGFELIWESDPREGVAFIECCFS